jgi:hypothetical protein
MKYLIKAMLILMCWASTSRLMSQERVFHEGPDSIPGEGMRALPESVLAELAREIAMPEGRLGLPGPHMVRVQGPEQVIPSMIDLYGDIFFIPVFTGRMAGRLLGAGDDYVLAVHLGYRLLGASAGGFGPPLPGQDRPVTLADDHAGADRELERLLSADGLTDIPVSFPGEQKKAWARLPLSVKNLILGVLGSAERAYAHTRDAFDLSLLAELMVTEEMSGTDPFYNLLVLPWTRSFGKIPANAFRTVKHVDWSELSRGSTLFLQGIRSAIERSGVLKEGALDRIGGCSFPSPWGKLALLGAGADHYSGEAAFVIDLGGDDRYEGDQAASRPRTRPMALLLDLDGDDVYANTGGGPGGMGLGYYGIGVLLDLSGNDRYEAGESGMGAALAGTGLLVDFQGDDTYTGRGRWTQGASHGGVGILMDLDGKDRYFCSDGSQGFGSTMGVGVLLDRSGNDHYSARLPGEERTASFVQGTGRGRWADASDGHSLGGGYGFLVDGSGDDVYDAAAWCQGAGYWWGFGSLEDHAGNDSYKSASYSLGSAAHFGIGCCVDLSGDDRYNRDDPDRVSTQLQGHARDGSVGIFMDGSGSDAYAHRNLCAGAGEMRGIGLFWDREGDDRYTCIREGRYSGHDSYGYAVESGSPVYESEILMPSRIPTAGIFLDTGGSDIYQEEKRQGDPLEFRNNGSWKQSGNPRFIGLGIDGDYLAPRSLPPPPMNR